jgi:hypothetical protein
MPESFYKEYDRAKLPMNDDSGEGEDNQGDRFVKRDNQIGLADSPEEILLNQEEITASGEEVSDNVTEVMGPGEVEKEDGDSDYSLFDSKEKEMPVIIGASEKIGVRRDASLKNGDDYKGSAPDKVRGKSKKPKVKDVRRNTIQVTDAEAKISRLLDEDGKRIEQRIDAEYMEALKQDGYIPGLEQLQDQEEKRV